jgi:hypothetical protein
MTSTHEERVPALCGHRGVQLREQGRCPARRAIWRKREVQAVRRHRASNPPAMGGMVRSRVPRLAGGYPRIERSDVDETTAN